VAFAGWDAAGASAFGHPVYWANRAGSAVEELGVQPDHIATGLAALPDFLARRG
jgi:2-haloacid dehalogenase